MQFKHPEILFALLLLIIPIIVHLFQLQRFTKQPFTNVKFLKKIELQSRKSSQLKKWLILATRLLAFTAIIFAFAQPYFSEIKKDTNSETIIYLDNSMSMSLKSKGEEILKKATQEIIENTQFNSDITLITNDGIFNNLNKKSLKNKLLNIDYTATHQDFKTILLKIKQQIPSKSKTSYNAILISDFQYDKKIDKASVTNVNMPLLLINVTPEQFKNSFLDSLYISDKSNQEITLKVVLNNYNTNDDNVSISLFNNTKLIGKTTTPFQENTSAEVEFKFPFEKQFNGKVVINVADLTFDNSLFFTITKPEKIKVLSIGNKSSFLPKIYSKNEFDYQHKKINEIDYNSISENHLIILNEIDAIPTALTSILKTFKENDGTLVIIPSTKTELDTYNTFFRTLDLGSISKPVIEKQEITTIKYSHPLLKNVFEKEVSNFQYPTVNQYFIAALKKESPIVYLENQHPFISQIKGNKSVVYWFSSPLNSANSNFENSPLIVPIFYNMGIYSYQFPQLYYTIGKENTIDVAVKLNRDAVLKLKNGSNEFIPLQQVYHNKVQLKTSNEPSKSGFYDIINKSEIETTIAYNYNRQESQLNYTNINELFKDIPNVSISKSIKKTFNKLNNHQKINSLFKWFLALGVLFLLLEIALLKFFKA